MANQKAISEEKFKRLRWEQVNGMFKSVTEITRKPFGAFEVAFEWIVGSGETAVRIKGWDFPILNTEIKETSYLRAIEAVKGYFNDIDEIVEKIPKSVIEGAKKKYTTELANFVATVNAFNKFKKEIGGVI